VNVVHVAAPSILMQIVVKLAGIKDEPMMKEARTIQIIANVVSRKFRMPVCVVIAGISNRLMEIGDESSQKTQYCLVNETHL
jgi:hypothetical protein